MYAQAVTFEEARRQAEVLFGEARELRPEDEVSRDLVELGRRDAEGKGFLDHLRSMTPSGFPIPELLQFGLTKLLGFQSYGPGEKMRWGIQFVFRDTFVAFELRKFGLRVLCERKDLDSVILKEVLGRARALTDAVEAYLSADFVSSQISSGNITVQNLHGTLNFRYRFLREQAEAAYRRPPPPPETGTSEFGTWTTYHFRQPEVEGSALGSAAVDAYFSQLEHLFVLASAFSEKASVECGVVDFLGANWPTKARAILDLNDPKAKALYDRLLEIREVWRNPLAHGGFMSGGGSFYFHLPGVGALPARLRRSAEGVRVGFSLREESFASILALFDEFDDYLRTGPLRFPLRWVEAGLDVAFDQASTSKYRAAMHSEKAFADLVDWTSMDSDRHSNMDY
jgi:hypothetical protein